MFDIIVLIVVGIGFWQGWRDGFAKSLCSFAGFFLGLLVAYVFYASVGAKLAPHLGDKANAAPIIAFLLIWIAVPVALNFVGAILTKFFSMLMLNGINTLAGGALGAVKYALGATLVIYVLVMMDVVSQESVEHSALGGPMLRLADKIMETLRDSDAMEKINHLPHA